MAVTDEAGPRSERPRFGEMLGQSFQGLWRGVAVMPLWTALAVAAVAAFSLWLYHPTQVLPEYWAAVGAFWPLILRIMEGLVRIAVTTPLCIGVQYLVLRQATPGWRGMARAYPAYFAWTFLFQCLAALIARWEVFVPVGLRGSAMAMLAVPFAGLLVLTVVSIRLMLIFPSIALGVRTPFFTRAAQAWRQLRGHFWFALGASFVAELAVLIPLLMIAYLTRPNYAAPAIIDPSAVLQALANGARSVLTDMLDASVAACLYRAIVEGGGPFDVEGTAAHFT